MRLTKPVDGNTVVIPRLTPPAAPAHATPRALIGLLGTLALLHLGGCGGGSTAESLAAATAPPATPAVQQATPPQVAVPQVSPARRINRDRNRPRDNSARADLFRTLDGHDNNELTPAMNEAETHLRRLAPAAYSNGYASLAGSNRPNPRAISTAVNAQTGSVLSPVNASDYLWQWGQFLDHDLDLTDGVDPAEPANIPIPVNDQQFDPTGSGTQEMAFNRSIYDPSTGTSPANARQQLNEITGWIDASNVYGSDSERARTLRSNDNTGQLATSTGNLLPFNTSGLANAGGDASTLFLAGDVRANEQLGLTAMHTLFMREHNRQAAALSAANPDLDGEEIYQRSRRLVGALMQHITYSEFLPLLLGVDALPPYRGYDERLDASVSNLFSGAAYRLGHSMLSTQVLRLNADGSTIDAGNLSLRDAFFAPSKLASEGGIDPILRGLAGQVSQRIDHLVVDDVRNFLFGQPGAGGFDLVSLNIQRGRDHGLADYNSAREALGLERKTSIAEISSTTDTQERLNSIYSTIDDMDTWVAGLAEDPVPGSMLGELFHTIVVNQFQLLRDGDRFWYERALSPEERAVTRATSLSDVIRRNTNIGDELADNVFVVSG